MRKTKVFLVDDEKWILEGLKQLISWEKLGFEISGTAGDGGEALEQITPGNTDILITDLKMPVMDGLELAAAVKKTIPGVEILVLTGFDEFSLIQESLRRGVADYLLKPVKAEELLQSVTGIKEKMERKREPYPFDAETRILQALSENNQEDLDGSIDELFLWMQEQKIFFQGACSILQKMMDSLDRYMGALFPAKPYLRGKALPDKETFMQMQTMKTVVTEVKSIFRQMMDFRNGKRQESMVDQIKTYILSHFQEDITLQGIAQRFYTNPSYVSQIFKKETGENYNDFLQNVRVEHAKKLLSESRLSIQRVGEEVGIGTSKYFSKVFRERTGMLPSQYRAAPPDGGMDT